MSFKTSMFGYPKIGPGRELKKAVEGFWDGSLSQPDLVLALERINADRISRLAKAGLDYVASNDFSPYDFMLDHAIMFGVVPQRFRDIEDDLERYFAMARGTEKATACEMTKWFDTNYHFIVPELTGEFTLTRNTPLESYRRAKLQLDIETVPVLIGPFTFLTLSKIIEYDHTKPHLRPQRAEESPKFRRMLFELARLYNVILRELEHEGALAVQLDEPALVLDRGDEDVSSLIDAYDLVMNEIRSLEVRVHTYYEGLSNYEKIVSELPVSAIGLDFTVNGDNLENVRRYGFPSDKKMVAGVLSGRDPWRTDLRRTAALVSELAKITATDRIILSNAAPLFHLPVSLEAEGSHLPEEIRPLLCFADERLEEMRALRSVVQEEPLPEGQDGNNPFSRFENRVVQSRIAALRGVTIRRPHPFEQRRVQQQALLNLPQFPTTTIGSFPQTREVRKWRSDLTAGRITLQQYDGFVQDKIRGAIALQEGLGLDVLVHGEFERTDMVEYFGQKLEGFVFTHNGWVQSYGTRCIRPPIIYGDVRRREPMTVKEAVFAQSLTTKPVKGMLTGPVTILNWSFYRRDIPKRDIAFQIALALQDEVSDLERAGIRIIQIDEPAFREGLPLRKGRQAEYLDWAVAAFRLTNAQVDSATQIHAHMCYSEFNEIIEHIYAMDTDVISIEASKSKGDILEAFERVRYDHGLGIGVYDVHSPRIPAVDEMHEIARRSVSVIDKDLFWINPDCGLKTRGESETIDALKNMVALAGIMRKKMQEPTSPAQG